jgi:ketosteroid isomerase-like protein
MTARRLLPLVALLAACTPSLIAGTQVPDTKANREVYGVIRAYAEAMQRRDAKAVLELVAPDYFDTAGTPDPGDDIDRAQLEKALPADLAKVDSMRFELGVKRIEVKEAEASAEVFYDTYYRVTTPVGPIPRRESDLHLMRFRRVAGAWKIASGL